MLDTPDCTHEDERGSTVMRVRGDRWECAVCGITFRLVREADAIDAALRSPTMPDTLSNHFRMPDFASRSPTMPDTLTPDARE